MKTLTQKIGDIGTARRKRVEVRATALIGEEIRMVDPERAATNVTRDMIRVVLNRLKNDNKIHGKGYGAAALWRKGSKKR
jgi:hypothetical protein